MHPIIIICAEYVFLVTFIGWAIVLRKVPRAGRVRFVAVTVLAGGIALALSLLAAHLHYEPRPFVAEHVKPLVSHGTDNGFPSDHAWLTMTLTTVVWFFRKRIAVVMAGATLLVGLGRVGAKLHSPQQIIAGWAIGIVSGSLAYGLITVYLRRRKPKT